MAIFITYSRADKGIVDGLTRDLERARNTVWMDNELTGGQIWWDTILGQIRACDLYLFALSPESLRSRACLLELDYAVALGRPLLPVWVRDTNVAFAPRVIADTQIVDYRERTVDNSIALISAIANRAVAPPLPFPLPPSPPPPVSYMNQFRELVDAPFLSFPEQNHLVADLRIYLNDADDRAAATELLLRLRQRRDVVESIGRTIDELLGLPRADPRLGPVPNLPPPNPSGPDPSRPDTPNPQRPIPAPVGSVPQPHPRAVAVLVLGILGLVICPITGIFAWTVGNKTLREIDAQPGRYDNRQMVVIGKVLGVCGVVLWGLLLVVYVIIFAATYDSQQ